MDIEIYRDLEEIKTQEEYKRERDQKEKRERRVLCNNYLRRSSPSKTIAIKEKGHENQHHRYANGQC